jgi:hypothetical protein
MRKKDFFQIQLIENLTNIESQYSRSYLPELACQFRKEELILRIKLNGFGVQVTVYFCIFHRNGQIF